MPPPRGHPLDRDRMYGAAAAPSASHTRPGLCFRQEGNPGGEAYECETGSNLGQFSRFGIPGGGGCQAVVWISFGPDEG